MQKSTEGKEMIKNGEEMTIWSVGMYRKEVKEWEGRGGEGK